MNLNHLRYLRLVVRHGTISAAARAAEVTQPAVTQAMQALQRHWGVELFEGSGKNRRPSRAAMLASQRIGLLESSFAGLASHVASASKSTSAANGRSGIPLRIGMSPVASHLFGSLVVRTWQQQLGQRGPVQMAAGAAADLLAALQRADLDVVVAPLPRDVALTGLRRQVLCSSTPVICARKGHALQGAQTLRELREAGWVIVGQQSGPGDMIDEALRVRRLGRARVLVHCADYATCMKLVAESDLLCIVPHGALVEAALPGRLIRLRVQEGLPQYDICVFQRADLAIPDIEAVVRALRDCAMS